MRDLARELGLIGSSLYSHIDSKEELLVEVVERGAALFQKSAEAALTVDGPATNRLKALVAGHVDVILNHRDQVRTFLYEADALEGAHRARVLAARDRYEGAFRQVLLEGKNAGLLRRTIDPTLSAIFVLSILNAVDRWYHPGGRLDRGRLVDEILVFALTGIDAP
jgi:AcrR family transcriptional regulator